MVKKNHGSNNSKKHRSRAAESIHRRIQGLVKSLLEKNGGDAIDGLPEKFELNLQIPVNLHKNDPSLSRQFSHSLIGQIEALRREGETEVHGHRSGHVHCYWCNQPDCEHSTPGDGHSVLHGWSATGVPIWINITNLLLSDAPDLLDHIHGDDLKPFALIMEGAELLAEVLPQYTEGTSFAYPFAGLQAAGFPLYRQGHEIDHLALTALVLETRTAKGTPRYRWNFISNPPRPHHLATLLGQESSSPLALWTSALRSLLIGHQEEIDSRAREGKRMPMKECRQGVMRILKEGKHLLDALQRRQDRKTKHAIDRSNDPHRPTSAAISDVLASKRSDLFVDLREATIIVRGPHGRTHVFTKNGIHVTSVRYSPESILQRTQRKRWVPLEDAEYLRFHEEVTRRLGNLQNPNRDSDHLSG